MATHNRKARARLEKRRADYAQMMSGSGKHAVRSDMQYHRPGSMKK